MSQQHVEAQDIPTPNDVFQGVGRCGLTAGLCQDVQGDAKRPRRVDGHLQCPAQHPRPQPLARLHPAGVESRGRVRSVKTPSEPSPGQSDRPHCPGAHTSMRTSCCWCSSMAEHSRQRPHPFTPGAEHSLCTEKGDSGLGLSCSQRSRDATSLGCPLTPPSRQLRPIMCLDRACGMPDPPLPTCDGYSMLQTAAQRRTCFAVASNTGSAKAHLCQQHLAAAECAAPADI